jgi:hypothetical protein
MPETYVDSLPTTERAAHKAILNRHDTADKQLADIDYKVSALVLATQELMKAVEAFASYEETRLFRFLHWLRLI